jgi:hypothetical protein
MDAREAGKLNAVRNNRNHWQIKEDDLKEWMNNRSPRKVLDTISEVSVEGSILSERLVAAQKEVSFYQAQLEKSETEKARLVGILKDAQRKRSLWEILFGQS